MSKGHEEATEHPLVARLVAETGVTREQAVDLISLLGVDWSSLIREARQLRGMRGFSTRSAQV